MLSKKKSFLYIVEGDKHPNIMPDLWQEAMDHAVALARKAGEVSQCVPWYWSLCFSF